jgi:hypothetical protein
MVFEIFTALVGLLALAYAGIARFIQNKLIDKSEMESIQKESKELSADYEKAKKAKDKKRMEEILQQQMEFLPRMNKAMMGQFKPMMVILVIFAVFTGVVGQLDPTMKDDIRLVLLDDGKGCDKIAGDGVFSACYTLDTSDTGFGKWTVHARMYESGAELGKNESYFLYKPDPDNIDRYVELGTGEGLEIGTDKESYQPGETVSMHAIPANMTRGSSILFLPIGPPRQTKIDRIEAMLSNGTYFRVDLPVTIPFWNTNRIYQPYTWFIMISLIANLALSVAIGQYDKMKKDGKKAGHDSIVGGESEAKGG